jgi:hypothetical protein
MGIQGTGLADKNIRLRFFSFIFMGIIAFGAVLYWRQQTLVSAEYAEPPVQGRNKFIKNDSALRSNNYQIEVEETSPTSN